MGSASRRNSTRAGKATFTRRSPTSQRRPLAQRAALAESHQSDRSEVLYQLNEVRSIFTCAARCLDELCDPHRLEASKECEPIDVAVVLRAGIAKLRKVQEFVDLGTTGDAS